MSGNANKTNGTAVKTNGSVLKTDIDGPGTYELPLEGFVPTATNYTTSNTGCIACHDYSEIDCFAKSVSLQKLGGLFNLSANQDTVGPKKHPHRFFDARLMLHSVQDVYFSMRASKDKALVEALRYHKLLVNQKDATLKTMFDDFAAFPIKSSWDYEQNDLAYQYQFSKLQDAIKDEDSDDEESKKERAGLQAKLKGLKHEWDMKKLAYEWLEETGRPAIVEAVASNLWLGYLSAKATVVEVPVWVDKQTEEQAEPRKKAEARRRALVADLNTDSVAQARLLFTWLASSIAYDTNLAAASSHILSAPRPESDMLATGKEVCRGYAYMFAAMFNSLSSTKVVTPGKKPTDGAKLSGQKPKEQAKPAMAEFIRGWDRPGGGPQAIKKVKDSKTPHAWNAFPYLPPNATKEVYQLIDITWAAPEGKAPLDTTWWSMTNSSFAINHIPRDVKAHLHAPHIAGIESQDLWVLDQPYFPGQVQGNDAELFDLRSVEPHRSEALKLSDKLTLEAQFRNNCLHQAKKPCPFKLGFVRNTTAKDAAGKSVKPEQVASFAFTEGQNQDRGLWKAKLTFTAKASGCLMIFTEKDSVLKPGTTVYPKIVAWDVKA